MNDWLQQLLDLGIGKLAIQTLALMEAGIESQRANICPYCKASIGKWARECGKCRRTLP